MGAMRECPSEEVSLAPRHSCVTSQSKSYGISRLTVRGGWEKTQCAAVKALQSLEKYELAACSSNAPELLVTTLRNLRLLSWLSHNGLRRAVNLSFNTSTVVNPLLSANLMRLSYEGGSAALQ